MVPLSPQASLIGARSRYPAMEGEEEQGQPPQEVRGLGQILGCGGPASCMTSGSGSS